MLRTTFIGLLVGWFAVAAGAQGVTLEQVAYGGWPNCLKLSNGTIELIATTDVGPRVIRLGFVGGQNFFNEYESTLGKTGGDEWRIYGGHRFWHAPEAKPRTYALDNSPIDHTWDGAALRLIQPVEDSTRIQKEIEIRLDPDSPHVTVVHRHINRNLWAVRLAPWALSVMAKNGRAIYPQEPYRPHAEYLLPARPLVLWHYTDMTDPRWTWGKKYIQLRQDPNATNQQKFGFMNKQGWAAYALGGEVFIKRYAFDENAEYPDYGCNTECYTDPDMLEVETVGPLTELEPNGGPLEHVEHWFLFKAAVDEDETALDETLGPLVRKTEALAR